MNSVRQGDRALLLELAGKAMRARGLEASFSPDALAEAARLEAPAGPFGDGVRDLRELHWCSIDNDDSRDLDQLTAAASLPSGGTRILVAIADVSTSVAPGSAVDRHAATNTTSVYTPTATFPMMPDRLSSDLTSLVAGEDRLAVVVDASVRDDGSIGASALYRAVVRNRAKLTYSGVGAWLEDRGALPALAAATPGLAANLKLQDAAARRLKARRHEHGALELDTLEPRATFDGDALSGLVAEECNRAKDLIEDFMIAANGLVAAFLEHRGFPVVRRIVREPERWPRIVEVAARLGDRLPPDPDAGALHEFLQRRRAADPVGFPDLSLSVIKLLGRGEYVASFPGETVTGHFGLAVSDYTHSTAPNRRYPDLVTQRLVLAALAGRPVPYERAALAELARHCTQKENDAQKVERLLRKSAAACLLVGRAGESFDGVVTGASPKGTWVRIFTPPVEGRVEKGAEGLDVGDRVRVRLLGTDVERGFIDFEHPAHEAAGPRQAAGEAAAGS